MVKGGKPMDDNSILDMFFARNESAISASREKYGGACTSLAYNILGNVQDTEEVLNDTFFAVWNAIPPEKPQFFSAFICKITRNLSLKKLRTRTAQKRRGNCELCLAELSECIPSALNVEEEISARELSQILDKFLRGLEKTQRIIFIRRYWYMDSIEDIAKAFGFGQSKVKMMLLRTRQKLLNELTKEGIEL